MENNTIYSETNTSRVNGSLVSSVDYEGILWTMNEELVLKRIPAIVFVSFLALMGSVGNGLVMFVYRAHLGKSTVNVFIFWMSVCDFSLCFFEMPYKAIEIRFPLLYGYPAVCKGFSFLEIFLSMVSIILLLCIAFDRYFVVQRPLQRLTLDNINKIIGVCVFLGVVFSWPTLFVYGQLRRPTEVPGVYAWGCGIDTNMLKSKVTPHWYYFLYAVFLIACVILITLYIRIWILIRKWKYTQIGESMSSPNDKQRVRVTASITNSIVSSPSFKLSGKREQCDNGTDIPTLSITKHKPCESLSEKVPEIAPSEKPPTNQLRTSNISPGRSSIARAVKHARMRRNTLIFGAIAGLFILSYLPILIIVFLRTSGLYSMSHASLWQAQLFEVLHRSGYINNAANPFIYAFLSPWFRHYVRERFCWNT